MKDMRARLYLYELDGTEEPSCQMRRIAVITQLLVDGTKQQPPSVTLSCTHLSSHSITPFTSP